MGKEWRRKGKGWCKVSGVVERSDSCGGRQNRDRKYPNQETKETRLAGCRLFFSDFLLFILQFCFRHP